MIIGLVGLALLIISAFTGGDDGDFDGDFDADIDLDVDVDVDVDIDHDVDVDSGFAGSGSEILQWFSVKALAVAAVGFGFMGWATTLNGNSAAVVWLAAIVTSAAVWVLAVKYLFPWIRRQQGHDFFPASAYQGLTGHVVVRVPAGGKGVVQFTDPSGAVIRRDALAVRRDKELPAGAEVMIVTASPEHVAVEDFSVLKDLE